MRGRYVFGIAAAVLLVARAPVMAERPPIQEMQSVPLTVPVQRPAQGVPSGQTPSPGTQVQLPTQVSPPSVVYPGQTSALPYPSGQPRGQNPVAPWPGQPPDAGRTLPSQVQTQATGSKLDQIPNRLPGSLPDQSPLTSDTAQPQWPNRWLPATAARIQALDKVNAQATMLTMKVGQTETFGSLTITLRGCVARPPDQPADAAAYLNVTDSRPDSPGFDGWMLANEPAVSMMQNPIYDLRVSGCS